MRSESLHAILPVLILVGLGLAIFAAAESVDPALRGFCSVSPFFSCAKVDRSGHTTTFGVPDWSIGIAGFVLLFALDVLVYRAGRGRWLDALTLVSGVGLAFSFYWASVELFVIRAFCLVCFGTYLANVAVLTVALLLRRAPAPERPAAAPGDGTAA